MNHFPNSLRNTDVVLAIDGGGTKIAVAAAPMNSSLSTTLAEVGTWSVEGTGSAHPSRWDVAKEHLARAIEHAIQDLTALHSQVRYVLFGLAGAGRFEDRDRVRKWSATLPSLRSAQVECVGDIDPLLDYRSLEPAKGSHSIAIILGTGSIVAARDCHGNIVRAGGWGPSLGDAASGSGIGLDGLRYVASWLDTGNEIHAADPLVPKIIAALEQTIGNRASISNALIQTANDRSATARLAPSILQLAFSGTSPVAYKEIVQRHVDQLISQITCVASRAFHKDAFHLTLAGGLIHHQPKLLESIVNHARASGLSIVDHSLVDPLLAVLLCALQHAQK